MEIIDVRQQIQNKKLDNFYIFTGPEWTVQKIYIDKIAACRQYNILHVDTVSSVFAKLKNKSIFVTPVCYVIRDDTDFIKNEEAWSKLEQTLDKNIIILQLTSVDKRSKFHKRYSDKIVTFSRLSTEVLTKYIQKELPLSNDSCKRLIEVCEQDYGQILLELDKIRNFGDTDYDNVLIQLLKSGVIYQPPQDVMFDWTDAFLRRKVKETFELYEECKEKGVSPLVMLSVLYTNVKQVLQVQDCLRENVNIEHSTGLNSYQVRIVREKCGHYSIGELVSIMKRIREYEIGIKTGKIEDVTALPLLMVNTI